MSTAAARAEPPPVAARGAFDRFIVAREGGR